MEILLILAELIKNRLYSGFIDGCQVFPETQLIVVFRLIFRCLKLFPGFSEKCDTRGSQRWVTLHSLHVLLELLSHASGRKGC